MKSITAKDLHQKIIHGEQFVLIDVREPFEHQHFNIGGVNIPLSSIFENKEQFNNDDVVIVYCQKGIRSQIAIQRLSDKFGYDQLINLQGGVDAWIKTFLNKKEDE
jgi:adenylyltransferase/sulfurtransferase